MPTPPLTEQDMRAAIEAFKANGYNKSKAADALGINRGTFNHRYLKAVSAGLERTR